MKQNKIELPYTLLTYDIETRLKTFHAFACGDTTLRHTQLTKRSVHQHNIICIAAKWYDKDKVMLFEGENAVEEFDKEARKADVCLGKNNVRFDVKYINTERMMKGLKPYPEWIDTSEDLEQQLRKNFNFTSQSLDYISELMGFGGKIKMEFKDWVDIHNYELFEELEDQDYIDNRLCQVLFKDSRSNIIKNGKAALKKMYFYNKKDVLDTEAVLIRVMPYIRLKKNANKDGQGCTTCGSMNIVKTKKITKGQTKYMQFDCLDHKGYAGKCSYHYKKGSHNPTYGTMQS